MTNIAVVDELVHDVTQSDYERSSAQTSVPLPRFITLFVVSLCIFTLMFAAFRTDAGQAAVSEERQALLDRIEQRTTAILAAESAVLSGREAIAALQIAQLNATEQGSALAQRIAELEVLAGLVSSSGPGVVVRVDDSAKSEGLNPSVDRVLDQDLQSVVNGLWQSGAAAIAINDMRLTSTAAIRSAGIAILVDYRPLNPPYSIVAIARPGVTAGELSRKFSRTTAAQLLNDLRSRYRIESTVLVEDRLNIPAATTARGSRQR